MATYTTTAVITNDTAEHYAAWGSAVHAGMAGAGLTQTADSGQVVWGSVNAVPGAGTTPHYEVWRFSDALQSTKPVFLKVLYGTNSGGAATPYIAVSVGTGSDGAGALTGPLAGARQSYNVTGSTTAASSVYFAGDGSWLALVLGLPWLGATYPWPFFALFLDRSRDETVTATADGLFLGSLTNGGEQALGNFYNSNSPYTRVWQQMFSFDNLLWGAASPGLPLAMGGTHFGRSFVGSNSYAFPMVTTHPRVRPGFICLGAFKTDYQIGAPLVMSIAGSSHTYLPFDYAASCCNPMGSGSANENAAGTSHTMLMRYE
jgi:hypothetical protein